MRRGHVPFNAFGRAIGLLLSGDHEVSNCGRHRHASLSSDCADQLGEVFFEGNIEIIVVVILHALDRWVEQAKGSIMKVHETFLRMHLILVCGVVRRLLVFLVEVRRISKSICTVPMKELALRDDHEPLV